MIDETKWNVKRGADVWTRWGGPNLYAAGPLDTGLVAHYGSDLLDGGLVTGLKCEWMAATLGVVPFLDVPGVGKGILQIGGAVTASKLKWPTQYRALESLYFWGQRSLLSIHGSVLRARRGVIPIAIEAGSGAAEFALPQSGVTQAGKTQSAALGALPVVAWIVIGVASVASVIAGAWYASRTVEQAVEVRGESLRATHAVGALADIASSQLSATGKVSPELLAAIGQIGSPKERSGDYSWAWALGGGAVVGAAGGYALRRHVR
jgi:hypothetical protein